MQNLANLQFSRYSKNNTTWSFAYDANGMRTQRTNGIYTFAYTYEGDVLTQMTVGGDVLTFTYGANGCPMSVNLNGTDFFYVTNALGDVVGILDNSGIEVVSYVYDAWGNIIRSSCDENLPDNLHILNPLRFRGYVYDEGLGLYYLQSRYYNPELCRFINADAYASTGQGILGYNMFAYCNNNPVKYVDYLGYFGICYVLDDPMNVYRSFMTPGMFGGGGGGNVAGISSTYYVRQNVSAYDRYWRNSCYNLNMSWSTRSDNISAQLQKSADAANAQVSGTGAVAGTLKHTAFSTEVKNLGNPSLKTEVSFLNGKEVPYGTKGSIRFDVVLFNGTTPISAWDFKTGAAILTEARISQMVKQSGLPIPIYMIK